MGQTESLKKIRGMRKDIARVKTIARERSWPAADGETIMAENEAQRQHSSERCGTAQEVSAKWSSTR